MFHPKRPSLFIIGAMKAGTTSLHAYLNAHPSIFMCEPKEPCYFVHPSQLNWPNMKKLKLWGNEDRYLELFASAGDATILGESSTLYAKLPHITDIPERIFQFNPDARFIYIMRDPIERTLSHYWHEVRQGQESQSLLTAIQNNPLYQDVSNYPLQLKPFQEQFGAEKILTLTSEALTLDPQASVRQVFQWLGVDAEFIPPNLGRKEHVSPKQFYQKGTFFRLRYTWPLSAIADRLPKSIRHQGKKMGVREIDRADSHDKRPKVIEYLRPIQQQQTLELQALLGREFPEWKTLWGSL
jgi:hypothetical protein